MNIKNKRADKKFELAILDYIKSKNIDLLDDDIYEIYFSIFNEIKLDIIKNKDVKKKDDEQFILAILDFTSSQNILLSDKKIKNLVEKMKLNIDNYIKVNEEKKISKINSMIFVKGGKYKPSFCDEEKEVFDLEVGKYPVTQKLYQEIMGYNPSYFNGDTTIYINDSSQTLNIKGDDRPVEKVGWWEALNFCNKLSEKYNLAPVYDLSKSIKCLEKDKIKINQLNGKKVSLDKADFKNTEGFRLPTEIEWEWFARGGEIAIKEKTFDYKYSGSNNIGEVAWYFENSSGQTHDVGLKKSNQLGLYDCTGNVLEWCFYDCNKKIKALRGASWINDEKSCTISYKKYYLGPYGCYYRVGFRVVRTI